MNDELIELRDKIDKVDSQMIQLLKERMELVKQVGLYKKEHNFPPLDEKRWEQVLQDRVTQAGDLSEETIRTIWDAIHKESLEIEEKVR